MKSTDTTVPLSHERLLRPGINFTSRGELKYARAVHLANELRGRIDEWSAAETMYARIVQADSHTLEFRLVLRREPPVEEWSLILGDALHNLRSAFDNVIWAAAHLDGAVPSRPTRVSFPLTATEAEWDKTVRTLESVPKVILGRVRRLQPWAANVEVGESMLGILHRLDNVDKHRDLIASSLHMKRILTSGLDLGLENIADLDASALSYSTRKTPVAIEDDALILKVRSAGTPISPDLSYKARVDVQFALESGTDQIVLIDGFLGTLFPRTREWLDLLYGGELHARGLIASRSAGVASVTFGYTDDEGRPHLTQLPMSDDPSGQLWAPDLGTQPPD